MYVGNLDEQVDEELLWELFLQVSLLVVRCILVRTRRFRFHAKR